MKKLCKLLLSISLSITLSSCSVVDTITSKIDEYDQQNKIDTILEDNSEIIDSFKNCYYLSKLEGIDLAFVTTVYKGVMNFKDSIEINLVFEDQDRPFQLLELLQYDCPEVFQFTTNGQSSVVCNWIERKNELISVEIRYILDSTTYNTSLAEMKVEIASLVNQANDQYTTDFEKELFIYDYIVDHCAYDENSTHNSSPYGVLIDHRAACLGLSRTMQWAMRELNIPCLTVGGYSEGEDSGHAWNIIQLNGEYYSLDVTSDTTRVDTEGYKLYLYMNVDDTILRSKYTLQDSLFDVPDTSKMDMNYYIQTGNYISSSEDAYQTVSNKLTNAIASGQSCLRVQFENIDDYHYIIENITTLYNECLNNAGHPNIQTSYSSADEYNVLYLQMD